MPFNKVVPELLCTDIRKTIAFYTGVLGFSIAYERPEETFAYLSLAGADLMFEQVTGPGRRWITGEMGAPFGRGVNFQIEVEDVALLYGRVLEYSATSAYLPVEDKSYVCDGEIATNRQFIVQDPDRYLLRFAEFKKWQSQSDAYPFNREDVPRQAGSRLSFQTLCVWTLGNFL